jgi:L-aspartate oxidase
MSDITFLKTDVLVLGAGLAGLRAAWAAKARRPEMAVHVVQMGQGASGASFANIHNRLGMQVCRSDAEKDQFVRDALAVAPPGEINADLVRILAEESEIRFQELEQLGIPLERTPSGNPMRISGCFSPGQDRAYIFSDMHAAYQRISDRLETLDVKRIANCRVVELIGHLNETEPGRVCGALVKNEITGQCLAVRAGAVVFALGGPAPLFLQNVAGKEIPGVSFALLKRAGVRLVNTPFLQFIWHEAPAKTFWPIQSCLREGALVRNAGREVFPVPPSLFSLAAERSSHAPVGYETRDALVDEFFIKHLSPDGRIDLFDPLSGWRSIALMAHAGNGGALIDENGWSGTQGLFVCGECASGMHGANRMGGGMVTGTQVFGARAGREAAAYAGCSPPKTDAAFREEAARKVRALVEDGEAHRRVLFWVRCGMQQYAIGGGRPGLTEFMGQVRERLQSVRDWRSRLVLESASIIGSAAMVAD